MIGVRTIFFALTEFGTLACNSGLQVYFVSLIIFLFSFLLQLLYVSVLVMCYIIYFMVFLGSPEATKKSFPVARMKALLPTLVEDEVGCPVIFLVLIFFLREL